MRFLSALLAAVTGVMAKEAADLCANPPAKGTSGAMGGIFGISLGIGDLLSGRGPPGMSGTDPRFKDVCKSPGGLLSLGGISVTGPEAPVPKSAASITSVNRGGTGPYKSAPEGRTDDSLPNHGIYAPLVPPPANVKLPVVVFSNGACIAMANMFPYLHTEIASHGYLVIVNGKLPGGGAFSLGGASEVPTMQADSIDWVLSGAASKYGNIDTSNIAAAGQSCGGLSSYSTSYHDDRVKLTVLLNSGVTEPTKRCLLKELKAPVAMLLGGPCDIANKNGVTDYDFLTVPKLKAHLDSGHMGTYDSTNGGKFAQAFVALLDWQFKGNETQKLRFSDPNSPNSFVKDKWYNITSSWFPQYESKSPYFNETYV
jgi:hypothetical protein